MGLEHDSRLHDMEIVAALKHRFPDWAMRLTSCAGKRAAPGLDKEVPTLPCTVRLGRGGPESMWSCARTVSATSGGSRA
jgi:hypothetical protein